MHQTLVFLSIGGVAGILSGIFGIGGGIVIVPALIMLLGFSQLTANGTSLVALLAPVGILGAFEYYRKGRIGPENLRAGMFIAVGLFMGVYIGSKIAVGLPEAVLRKSFALFVGAIALKLWFSN